MVVAGPLPGPRRWLGLLRLGKAPEPGRRRLFLRTIGVDQPDNIRPGPRRAPDGIAAVGGAAKRIFRRRLRKIRSDWSRRNCPEKFCVPFANPGAVVERSPAWSAAS